MARRQRIRRKDLFQPDEFVSLSRRGVAFISENRASVLAAAGVVVLIAATLITYSALATGRAARASDAYRRAHRLLADRSYAEAAAAFQKVVADYGSTTHGPLAQLEAANALLLAGEPADAAAGYRAFLAGGPPTDYLRQVALTRLAHALEETDQHAEAMAAYASAREVDGPYDAEAMLGQARTALASGDEAGARELYTAFLERFPESDSRDLVNARIIALGGTPPAAPQPDAEAAG